MSILHVRTCLASPTDSLQFLFNWFSFAFIFVALVFCVLLSRSFRLSLISLAFLHCFCFASGGGAEPIFCVSCERNIKFSKTETDPEHNHKCQFVSQSHQAKKGRHCSSRPLFKWYVSFAKAARNSSSRSSPKGPKSSGHSSRLQATSCPLPSASETGTVILRASVKSSGLGIWASFLWSLTKAVPLSTNPGSCGSPHSTLEVAGPDLCSCSDHALEL